MTLSRRSMFTRATVGGVAIVGAAALAPVHRSFAQNGDSDDVVLICTEDNVRVRSEPSLSGTVRGTVDTGDRVSLTGVTVMADGYRWLPVSVHGTNLTGWSVDGHFQRPDGSALGWLRGTVVHVNTTRVNLHAGPGVNYKIVGNFNTGTEAVVNDGPARADGHTWYNITIDNVTGWMSEDYLTEGRYANTATSPAVATTSDAYLTRADADALYISSPPTFGIEGQVLGIAADAPAWLDAPGGGTRVIDAEARGLVINSTAAASANAKLLNRLIQEVSESVQNGTGDAPHIVLPSGPIYYDGTLDWRSHVAIVGQGKERTLLYYTGSGHGVTSRDVNGYVEQCLLQGLTLRFAGSGTGDGFYSEGWHVGVMRDVIIERFPGSGFHGVAKGNWMTAFFACEFRRNGRHGIELYEENNNLVFTACRANMNALDGVYVEKSQGITMPDFQSEGNGRHAFHIRGVKSFAAPGAYAEHHDLEHYAVDLRPPGWTRQSPRYVVCATKAADGTRNGYVGFPDAGYLSASHNGSTTTTDAVVCVEHTNHFELGGFIGWANHERDVQIADTVDDVTFGTIQVAGYSRDTTPTSYLRSLYATEWGGQPADIREPVGRRDAFQNLIANGGFDAFSKESAAPAPWSASGVIVRREPGTDGGHRITAAGNGSAAWASLRQTLDGPEIRALAGEHGVLVFDAIVPNTNTLGQTRVYLRAFAGPNQTGGQVSPAPISVPLNASDDERTYVLPFVVPAGAQSMDLLFSLDTGKAGTDVLKIDRVALYPGWVAKRFTEARLSDLGGRIFGGVGMYGITPPAIQPPAIRNTSGASLAALEAEVNKLKEILRAFGIVAK